MPPDFDGDEFTVFSETYPSKIFIDLINAFINENNTIREELRGYYEHLSTAEEWRRAEDALLPSLSNLERIKEAFLKGEAVPGNVNYDIAIARYSLVKSWHLANHLREDSTQSILRFMRKNEAECVRLLLNRPEAFLYEDPFS